MHTRQRDSGKGSFGVEHLLLWHREGEPACKLLEQCGRPPRFEDDEYAWGPLYHQDMAECIVEHFNAVLTHVDRMATADDTVPEGDLNPEDME